MDPLETLLRAAHEQLERLAEQSIHFALDNLEHAEHASFPRVSWIEQGGEYKDARGPGGVDAELTGEWAEVFAYLWFRDVQECRERKGQLLNAVRLTWTAGDYQIGTYEAPARTEQRHANAGALFTQRFSVRLSVPLLDPSVTTTTILSQRGDVEMSDGTANVEGSAP